MNRRHFLALAGAAAGTAVAPALAAAATGGVKVSREPHRGWADALFLRNPLVEVVVVPSLGRVMQFRFRGGEDVFWENPALEGKPMPPDPWGASVGSFGGDKTWPAPQSLWNWPPPDAFDRLPVEGRIARDQSVVLVSPVGERFGIRTERHITLDPAEPVLRIRTTYHKEKGDPLECGVWVITQLRHPERVFLPIPAGSRFRTGWSDQWKVPAGLVTVEDGLVSLTRSPVASHKVGNDGNSLLWVGANDVLRIDTARVRGARYPDDGCSVEVYTNADPTAYVELETLGPLQRLASGRPISATNTYRLFRRTRPDAWAEARALLGGR